MFSGNDAADFTGFRLHLYSGGGDSHLGGHLAQFQRQVQAEPLAGIKPDALSLGSFEPGQLGRNVIDPCQQGFY